MRLSRRISVVVGVVLAGCGGATEGPGTSTSSSSGSSSGSTSGGSSSGGSSGTSGTSGTSGNPNDCPHLETVKSFSKVLMQSEVCQAEKDKQFMFSGFAATLTFKTERCSALCEDAEVNFCDIPADARIAFQETYPNGPQTEPSTGPGTCPFADRVSPFAINCQQRVQKGTQSSGCPVEGRRFEGYASASTCSGDASTVARYFASCAHLEAASVVAFDRLAGELTFHGAPHDLVAACRAAACEEIEHAASVSALARRFGAEPATLDAVAARAPRALVDIAVENAVEGMVRELFGAAQAHWRAARASDATVRDAMLRIAEDESRHAELSSRIGSFLDAQLDPISRARVQAAAEQARADLRRELACADVDPSLVVIAGVPSRDTALALFDALERDIWLAAA